MLTSAATTPPPPPTTDETRYSRATCTRSFHSASKKVWWDDTSYSQSLRPMLPKLNIRAPTSDYLQKDKSTVASNTQSVRAGKPCSTEKQLLLIQAVDDQIMVVPHSRKKPGSGSPVVYYITYIILYCIVLYRIILYNIMYYNIILYYILFLAST